MDCRSAQTDFNLLISKLPTSVLSNFVVWLDLKIAEYKVFGRILSDAERPKKNDWTQLSVSAFGQKMQPVSDRLDKTRSMPISYKTSLPETVKQKHNKVSNSNHQSYKSQNSVHKTDDSDIINLDSDEDLEYESVREVFIDDHRSRSLDQSNKESYNESDNLNIKVEPDDDVDSNVENQVDMLEDQSVHLHHKEVPDRPKSDFKKGQHKHPGRSEVKEIKLEDQSANDEQRCDRLSNNYSSQRCMSKGQTQHFMNKGQGQGHQISNRPDSDKPFVEEIQSTQLREISESEIHEENAMYLLQNLEEVSAIPDDNHGNTFSSLTWSSPQNDTYFEDNQEVSLSKLEPESDYQDNREPSFFRLSEQGQGKDGGNDLDKRSVHVERFDIQFPETDASSLKMCNICYSIFSNIRELQRHFSTCHPEDTLTPGCVFCGSSFPNDSILKRHIACDHIGSNIGFQCIFCGKEFSQAQHFQGHLNQHRGVQPFKCKRCGKSFTYKTHLTCHMRNCGGINGKYKCNLCHRVFLERGHLTEHMHGMHNSGNPRYKCEFCGERFVWRGSLVRHKKLKCQSNPARQ